ncbi:MAG: serine/threonine-protein phosphatase [Oscillibacter sp.]|nr:serine/threonine-protein phosphatase [Oscillibacter sp.]
MSLKYAGCSEVGLVRGNNEDAFLMRVDQDAGLFLVADGIGGRADGEVVSAKIRDDYDRWWTQEFLPMRGKLDFHAAVKQMQNVLFTLNREVVERYGEHKAGSTLAMLFLYGGNCAYVWTGDSRIYRFRGLSLDQISRDDVYRAKDSSKASLNGKLTSAVGLRTSLEFNTRTDNIRNGDGFFLCSDGVYRFAKPDFLRRKLLFNLSSPEHTVEAIRKEVLKNGAKDNYSMVLVKARL